MRSRDLWSNEYLNSGGSVHLGRPPEPEYWHPNSAHVQRLPVGGRGGCDFAAATAPLRQLQADKWRPPILGSVRRRDRAQWALPEDLSLPWTSAVREPELRPTRLLCLPRTRRSGAESKRC